MCQLVIYLAHIAHMARISIIIPDNIIEKVDRYSQFAGYSRSEFLRFLVRRFFIDLEKKEKEQND